MGSGFGIDIDIFPFFGGLYREKMTFGDWLSYIVCFLCSKVWESRSLSLQ